MCEVGRTDLIFTDSSACFMASDMRLRQCICPFATCTATTKGYGCRITTTVSVLAGFLITVWLLAGAAYLYLSNYIGALELEARAERHSRQGAKYYYSKLFGTSRGSPVSPSAPELAVKVATTNPASLISRDGKQT